MWEHWACTDPERENATGAEGKRCGRWEQVQGRLGCSSSFPAPQAFIPSRIVNGARHKDLTTYLRTSHGPKICFPPSLGDSRAACTDQPHLRADQPQLSLSTHLRAGPGHTHLWKTAEQSAHTDVWLSNGNSTSPSLQSSHTNPLAWHRWQERETVWGSEVGRWVPAWAMDALDPATSANPSS